MISYFSQKELACKCCGAYNVDPAALEKLTLLREALGRPLYINSACRCPDHNKAVGGGKRSQHLCTAEQPSTAFDVALRGHDKEELIAAAKAVGFRGLGINYKSFVHVDNRPGRRATW